MFNISVEKIREDPDIILFRNLVSKEECEHIIKKAEKYLVRSSTFTGKDDPRRTSWTAYTNNNSFNNDEILKRVKDKISMLSGLPVTHIEPPQIVRYKPGQKFLAHSDCYEKKSGSYKVSGQRDYTFFIYLNEPSGDLNEPGGETEFTNLEKSLKVKPERGMGAFWRNIDIETGEIVKNVYHQGLPPKDWVKWGMNVWIRHKSYKG
jgi:prolyl 4-hydroxylase